MAVNAKLGVAADDPAAVRRPFQALSTPQRVHHTVQVFSQALRKNKCEDLFKYTLVDVKDKKMRMFEEKSEDGYVRAKWRRTDK